MATVGFDRWGTFQGFPGVPVALRLGAVTGAAFLAIRALFLSVAQRARSPR